MAQHNTDYGLVYSDDGKICVTKRTDIVPFPGITSYAVETGTTNLVQNPQFLNGTANYWSYTFGGTGYIEVVNNIMNMHNESSTTGLVLLQSFTIDNTKEHTISCRVRSANGQDCPIDVYFGAGYYNIGTAPASGAWVTLERTYAPSQLAASSAMHFKIGAGKYLQIDWLQFEQKPFASSFVNGSRPNGRLVVPKEKLGFNPATDDWVVHYWKYPVATRDDSLTTENLCSIGQLGSGYIYWGKMAPSNNFTIDVTYDDNTHGYFTSLVFDPAWYFRNWHHEVVLKRSYVDGTGELQYWVDGILQVQASLTKPLNSNFTLGLSVGGHRGLPDNTYIANLCYGLYTPQWTPEYIQEIYQQRNGFFVPPKAVIV